MSRKNAPSRRHLYAQARQRGIAGRSKMSRAQLQQALDGQSTPQTPTTTQTTAFEQLATRVAQGDWLAPPQRLAGHARRRHVRDTIREDHDERIANDSPDARNKFKKMAKSPFLFFRGTALLFYRDMAGEDADMPSVLNLGDVHPENFGVMANADNVPMFGVNDFDEACYAPFTWDLKRGAAGFMLAAETEAGYSAKRQHKIARRFVQGYADAIAYYAEHSDEDSHQWRYDNAPKLIRELLDAADEPRAEWLAQDYLNTARTGFRPTAKLVPVSNRRREFQHITDRLVAENDLVIPERAAGMHVKDVAIRRGQGTASLGLARYYVLIEGPAGDASDDLILEYKQARASALAGLAPPNAYQQHGQGRRVAHAQAVHLVQGDRFYAPIDFEARSFICRERPPYKDDIDLDALSKGQWKAYARICGEVLAQAHALSDEAGRIDTDLEPALLRAIGPTALFVDDIVHYAGEAAARVRADYRWFRTDHELGAFAPTAPVIVKP